MVKYGFNERWRDRDRAYREFPNALLNELYGLISDLAEKHFPKPKQKRGRPPKIPPAKAAFLAVIKEHHHEMTYRELATSKYVYWLGISGVHYTTIQKAIARLPEGFLEEAARVLAELVSPEEIDCVADATEFSIRKYEIKEIGLEKRRKRKTVKLSGIWDPVKKVFHAGETIHGGGSKESMNFTDIFDRVRRRVRKLIADPAYASREIVQHLADGSTDPVIKLPKDATPKMKGSPAWSDLVREFKKLGYEVWKSKSGYEKRFENEGMFGAFIERFGDEVKTRSEWMASKLLEARMVLHNFFAFLVHT